MTIRERNNIELKKAWARFLKNEKKKAKKENKKA